MSTNFLAKLSKQMRENPRARHPDDDDGEINEAWRRAVALLVREGVYRGQLNFPFAVDVFKGTLRSSDVYQDDFSTLVDEFDLPERVASDLVNAYVAVDICVVGA